MARLEQIIWPASLIAQAKREARLVSEVIPGSPAALLGIEVGWLVLRCGGEPPNGFWMSLERIADNPHLVFCDPKTDEVIESNFGHWPAGFRHVPMVNEGLLEEIANDSVDRMDLHGLWLQGNWKAFAETRSAWETVLRRGAVALIMNAFSPSAKRANLAKADDVEGQVFYALALLAAGDFEDASFFVDASDATMDRLNAHAWPSDTFALQAFIRAHVANAKGDCQGALEIAKAAQARTLVDNQGLARLIGQLENRQVFASINPSVGGEFGFDYTFPQNDIHGIFPADQAQVSYAETLQKMRADQMLIVTFLGDYRRNRPFMWDMCGIAALNRALPDRIFEHHVVSSNLGPDDNWESFTEWEKQAAKFLPKTRFLLDIDRQVDAHLNIQWNPTHLVMSKSDKILAIDSFNEEQAFWQALDQINGMELSKLPEG